MKKIPLTQGKVALVDDKDYEALMKWKWFYLTSPISKLGYAARTVKVNGKRKHILMHRVILNTPFGYQTDHVNGDGLDNRKVNLRIATRSQNQCNTNKRQDNTSGFKGVSWHKQNKRWQAYIGLKAKQIYLGLFKDKDEAALAYNEAAIKLHGEFAHLNQIDN